MRPADGFVLDAQSSVEKALAQAEKSSEEVLLVQLSPREWSSVKKEQLRTLAGEGKGTVNLGEVLDGRRVPFLHPDHPLETALRYVDRWTLVPVVNRADLRKLEGVITERDVLERYREFGEG